MDASTFYERNQIVYNLHLNLIFAVWNSLSSVISYNPEQKWYYYSKQNTKEVLVFHQYSKVKNKILNEILIKIFFLILGKMVVKSSFILSE